MLASRLKATIKGKTITTTIFPEVPGTQEVYSKPMEASKVESFATTVNDFQSLTIVTELSVLDVHEVPSYVFRLNFIKLIIKHPCS